MNIIPVIELFTSRVLETAVNFLDHPAESARMEQSLDMAGKDLCAELMKQILEEYDDLLVRMPQRKKKYTVQRHDSRTLITGFGDVTFQRTLFRSRADGTCHYLLDEQMHLPKNEHLSEMAEVRILNEAAKVSYQHAADSLKIGSQTVSKVAVMNKIHKVLEELPIEEPKEKRVCERLYIEADEDHIHRQKAGEIQRGDCIIGKLVYVFEGKEEACEGKKRLINPVYFGGEYSGSEGNAELWKRVQEYIQRTYDRDHLKKVYISGDGAAWIGAGTDYIDRSVLVADRFHLMKYINAASRTMLDSCDEVKGKFYKYIYKNKLKKALKLLRRMKQSTEKLKPIEALESYLRNNWNAIQVAFHDKNVPGCSAEGHVSNIYSDRMSSRPMGWSETGADRMCRLRCLIKTYGDEKIVDLVKLRREQACEELRATGTDDLRADAGQVRKKYTKAQLEAASYAERMQATLSSTLSRKQIAIILHKTI